MTKLYSYCLPYDDGAAPNPFWGTCTLVICKPAIRRTARVGDWIAVEMDAPRIGRQLAFANVRLMVGEKQVARASGVFTVLGE